MDDAKKTDRETEETAKETWRRPTATRASPTRSDAGDDIRKHLYAVTVMCGTPPTASASSMQSAPPDAALTISEHLFSVCGDAGAHRLPLNPHAILPLPPARIRVRDAAVSCVRCPGS